MKLLIVDDHPANLRLLRAQLEASGHEVVDAANGADGLRRLRESLVDGVISDILMPEMDGYRFCIEVRGDVSLRGLPFVLYTSTYNSPADRQLALNAGADAYISKPAPVGDIIAALEKAAQRKHGAVPPAAREAHVLRQYSEVLVRKLEDKNLELEKSLEQLELVHEIDRALIGSRTPAQIAEALLPRLRQLLGMRIVVNKIDPQRNESEWLVATGPRRIHTSTGGPEPLALMGDIAALKRGEPQRIEVASLPRRPDVEMLRADGVRWFMVMPMIANDELIGALSFGGPSSDFPDHSVEVARHAAAQLAIAIHQAHLDDQARLADAQYRLIFENVPLGITLTGADGRVMSGNQMMARMLGYDTVEEAIRALEDDAERVYVHASDRKEYVRRLRADGIVREFEAEIRRRDGSRFWSSLYGRLVSGPAGPQLVTIADDITMRKLQEARISRLSRVKEMRSAVSLAILHTRERQGLLDAVCRVASAEGGFRAAWIVWHDEATRQLAPVSSAGHLDGFLDLVRVSTDTPADQGSGFSLQVLRSGVPVCTDDLRNAPNVAHRKEALERGYLASMHLPLTAGKETRGVLVLCAAEAGYFDAEERQLLEELAADVSFALEFLDKSERLDYLAYYDPLTGLANRSLFHDRLSHSLRPRVGDPTVIAVALLDIERFRRVNETLGRQAGDELLHEVGARLHRQNDSTARLGSDMFALVLRGARSAAEVNRALESLLGAAFTVPVRIRGEDLRTSCRAGVALYPNDGADADALLRNAEAALRRSKSSAESIVFYAAEMNAQVADALSIENKLRLAIERREFVLHYQPKMDLESGRMAGAEALIRWNEPEKGLVPPGRFIPVLEETGLIGEVGRWALEQTFVDLNEWRKRGLRPPRIAVNVSAIQLQDKGFVDTVIAEIERGGDFPELLELEITESLVMRNVDDSTRKLSIVRGMGVTIAIDDFGTGYSSLAYLSRLPVDKLKIDRSFVANVANSGEATTLVTTMIGLAHGLKLKVVAEGVETQEQAHLLRLFRCDQAQGYLYSKPVPADAFARLLSGKTP
jgi:diguanylate cyclase (GGDEF)-like protein/PAS domain S-box-containing protein